MKKLTLIFTILFYSSVANSQFNNWTTVGGGSTRDGRSENFFDFVFGFNKTYSAPSTIWGMPIFAYNNYFTTSRYLSLSPLRASIATYVYNNQNPVWTFGENSGVNIVMGFNNDLIYVRDFQQNGFDTIFALNASDGSLVWKSRFTVERGIIWTAVFAANGDLIVPGSGTKRIMRINHLNGDTVWTNDRIIPNTGAEGMCINGNTLYTWQGTISTPKTILAIDVNTGSIKYSSQPLPGDGDQEIPITVSRNGVVYCIRDGGLMYALQDNGNGFTEKWSRGVQHPVGTYTQIAVGNDSSVYIPFGKKIYRINHQTGAALDSSTDLATSGNINPRFGTGRGNNIYVSNGADNPAEGKFFIFTRNLQLLWQYPYSYNYYCGPALGGQLFSPFLLYTGAGSEIKAQFIIIDDINSNTAQVNNFRLHQNFPNPFNPQTRIQYELKTSAVVTLKIYNQVGNEVTSLINSGQNAGSYNIVWNAGANSSGVYYYQLTVNDGMNIFRDTKKMILIR